MLLAEGRIGVIYFESDLHKCILATPHWNPSSLISNVVLLLGLKSGSVFLASFLLAGYSCSLEFFLHANHLIPTMHRL